MITHLKWALIIGFSFSAFAGAAEKSAGMSVSGNFEGGYAAGFGGAGGNVGKFLVDHANMNMTYTVTDSTKVVVNNVMSVIPGAGLGGGVTGSDSRSYFGSSVLSVGNFTFANAAAYIDWKCADGVHTQIGHFATPFGMESMWDRYDMATYYYSQTYSSMFAASGTPAAFGTTFGWRDDIGLKVNITEMLPGMLEIALTDGRTFDKMSPRATLRWNYEMKSGDMSLTPVISALLGRWAGGPKDLGLSAGFMYKMGALWANAEFLYGSVAPSYQQSPALKSTNWGIIVEPGFDLGLAMLSLKWEFQNQTDEFTNGAGSPGRSDMNIGLGLSHTYANGMRVKVAYSHMGFKDVANNGIGGKANDFRILFGTKW